MSKREEEIIFKSPDIECAELGTEYKRIKSILKRIADICKAEKRKGFIMSRYGAKEPISQGYDLACRILKELEILRSSNESNKNGLNEIN